MAEFRFQLLGPVRAWRDDAELDVGSPQQRAILAVLLLAHGSQVSLETMIDALWGENPPKASTGAVRTYVSRLRQTLTAGSAPSGIVIEPTGDGYMLRGENMTVDMDVFEERVGAAILAVRHDSARATELSQQALALWRGTPLAGVPGPYAEPVRTRMAEIRADAAEIESSALIASGDHLSAIAGLRTLVATLPLRENLHELLMLALYRAGRQADALDVYTNARRILRDELGIEPGPSLRRMHQRVLGADESLVVHTARVPRQASRAPRLPAALTNFTGRRALLEALSRQLRDEDTGLRAAIVRGMPGIGKTAFAVRAAHLVAQDYPDGQVFIELGGSTNTPMRPGALLSALLRSAGLASREIPNDLASRAWAWRETLAGRRTLVVLDDVDSIEQVRTALIAPVGCAFILTSRKTLIGVDDAVHYEVPGLADDEARELLERLIGAQRLAAEPEAAQSLIAHCAGHPSAIRSIGARLAARPDWELTSASRHLRETLPKDPYIGAESAEAPLESAYRRLTPLQAYVFRGAAALDGLWVPVGQAAAELGMPESAVREAFEFLTDVHLLKPGKWGTYSYDPAVKTFARRLAERETAAGSRLPGGG